MAKGFFIGVENFKKRNLPSGYTQLEYIESTGSQYINTGFKPDNNTRLVCDHYMIGSGSGVQLVFGAWDKAIDNAFMYLATADMSQACVYYDTEETLVTASASGRHTVDANKNAYYLDGNLLHTCGESNFTCSYPIFLCAYNSGGTATSMTIIKIYSCQIYDNETLVRDFVPCINSSGTAGLYDIVNDIFYTNAGTGTFSTGTSTCSGVARKVKEVFIGIGGFTPRALPSGYTQVSYIESTGTQYIDTGFKPSYNTRVVMDISGVGNSSEFLFGARNSASSGQFNAYRNSEATFRSDYFGSQVTGNISDVSARMTVDKNTNITTLKSFSGDVLLTITNTSASSGQCSYPLFLLALNDVGNPLLYASAKLHGCKIYDGSSLVRDFVPCINSSGVAGLYDMINGMFYTNAGTGTFAAGSSNPNSAIARRIKEAFIGIGGVARPCWSTGELAYYGTITSLSVARYRMAATTIGNYALFGGGTDSGLSNKYSTVDAYSKSLTRTTPTALSSARDRLAAATAGNYALFGGGATTTYSNVVDAYDVSLTRTSPTSLSYSSLGLAATSIGSYILFGGGNNGDFIATVNAYDASLTRTRPTSLSVSRSTPATASSEKYALFGGGSLEYNGKSATVDAYNTSLTRTNPADLSAAKENLAGASIGDYILFGGGGDDYYHSYDSTVDAYDASLTKTSITPLSIARYQLAATTIGDHVMFGGGYSGDGFSAVVEVYDASLTMTIFTSLSSSKTQLVATTVGDYALFGSGMNESGSISSAVDAYVVA